MRVSEDVTNILKISQQLKFGVAAEGTREIFNPGECLFRTGDANVGVYLVCSGQVRLSVDDAPQFDRLFSEESLLGLPSTFTESPYSLSATAIAETEVIHVTSEKFLQLMKTQPRLCQEATEVLSREVAFIQGALAKRRHQASRV